MNTREEGTLSEKKSFDNGCKIYSTSVIEPLSMKESLKVNNGYLNDQC